MGDRYFLVFGLVLAAAGLLLAGLKLRVIAGCRERVPAVISKVHRESTVIRGSTLHTYRPEYTYTAGGKRYRAVAPFSSVKEKKYTVGDETVIYISAKNPELYRFRGRAGMLIAGVILFGTGALFVVLWFL